MKGPFNFSRRIVRVDYDPETEKLIIGFNNGTVYEYGDVPASLYIAMEKSRDQDSFFEQKVFGRFRLIIN